MSMTVLRAALAVVIGTGLAMSAVGTATAQSQNTCIAYRDIERIQAAKDDDMTAVVTTRRHDYLITFRARCPVRAIGGSFGLDRNRLGPCIKTEEKLRPLGNVQIVDSRIN